MPFEFWPDPAPQDPGDLARWSEDQLRRLGGLLQVRDFYQFKVPASVTLNNGTSGDAVSDIRTLNDGNEYAIAEVTGVPGIDLRINFVDIRAIWGFVIKSYYSGSATHYVNVELYNYNTSTFDLYITVEDTNSYNYRTILIPNGENHFDGDGNAVMRIYHPVTGDVTHDAYIEYAALLA